jgi:hypothetical protein
MHLCNICNYLTPYKSDLKKHYLSEKHQILNTDGSIITQSDIDKLLNESDNLFSIIDDTQNNNEKEINNNINYQNEQYMSHNNEILFYKCLTCSKFYKHQSSFSRHKVKCNKKTNKTQNRFEIEIQKIKSDHEIIKKDLEIARLKTELTNKDSSVNNLQVQVNKADKVNLQNNTINNNVKISKIQYLNVNFGDVIDINTFISNYKNEYGLTNKQTETLLDNYKNGGINSCISTLVYYLKESAIQQYKEIKGKEISKVDIILPFILSDKYLREHFEKNVSGEWDKTTMFDNIKTIVGITDDHIYKHHNTYMQLSDPQKKKLINGVLKASGYSQLSQLSSPDLYKIKEEPKTETKPIQIENNSNLNINIIDKTETTNNDSNLSVTQTENQEIKKS